jgi:hypothetical protein
LIASRITDLSGHGNTVFSRMIVAGGLRAKHAYRGTIS